MRCRAHLVGNGWAVSRCLEGATSGGQPLGPSPCVHHPPPSDTSLLSDTDGGFKLNDAAKRNLDMIDSHSKGNWAVQAALLNFELDVAGQIQRPAAIDKRIDVVTFGNWVDLPDQDALIKELFHYHQFVGTHDKLALLNSPSLAMARLVFGMFLDTMRPADHGRDPDEMMFYGCDSAAFTTGPSSLA